MAVTVEATLSGVHRRRTVRWAVVALLALIALATNLFFFARLWRRARVMTDVEFAVFRYSGQSAAFLLGFRAL